MKKILYFLVLTFVFIGCGEECYNAPLPVVFEFVNSNNENLIANGTLTNFTIQEENQGNISVSITDENKVVLNDVGLYNGTKNYIFNSPIKTFKFSIESSEFKGGCDGFQINKLTFTGYAIDVTDQNGYYKIEFQ